MCPIRVPAGARADITTGLRLIAGFASRFGRAWAFGSATGELDYMMMNRVAGDGRR
jgi:hypothetical protein